MHLTQTQSLLGTPAYMSPEQMRSARLVDQRTDIWSLGTVMYELLEGRRPFEADSFSEMCVKVAVDAPEPMVNTPPALQQVVLRCLAKSPEQRYANMAELGRDLIPFARDPHNAQMMVERMFRMLGRQSSGGTWEGPSTNTGVTRTPNQVRDFKSGPVRAQSPAIWHGGSDPAAPLDSATHKDRSVPAVLPIDVSKKGRWGLVVAVVVAVAIAIAGVVMFYVKERGGEEAANVTAPAPAPAPALAPAPAPAIDLEPAVTPPPLDPAQAVTAPKPDDTPAPAIATDLPKPDEIKKADPVPRAAAKKAGRKPSSKAPVAKKPDKQIEKPKDPKDEVAKPAAVVTPPTPPPPPPKRDVYATPRAEQ